jgi:phosphate transport system protein
MIQRINLTEDIKKLHQELLKMATLVEESIQKAVKALLERDKEIAREVINADEKINVMELAIEDQAITIIATEQPVASDLRDIAAAFRIISTLERMGDYAAHIAKTALKIADKPEITVYSEYKTMTDKIIQMLRLSMDAYFTKNPDQARDVAMMDDEIDKLYKTVIEHLFGVIRADQKNLEECISLLFVARYCERLGDQTTNICEFVFYSNRGTHVELNP